MIYPKITYEDHIENTLNDTIIIDPKYKKINIYISGGGMAVIYSSGPLIFIHNFIKNKQIEINHIYGTSAGAICGLFFIWYLNNDLFDKKYYFNISYFINFLNNDIRNAYNKHSYVVDNFITLLEKIIPPDLYKYCNDKLFITIHIIDGWKIKQEVISNYYSNEHLLNVLKCSSTIPYITIPKLTTIYYDLFSNKKFYAFDGVFPRIVNKIYPTFCIDLIYYDYPFLNRMRCVDKTYDTLFIDGFNDAYNFFKYNKYHKKYKNILYFYNSEQNLITKIYNNILNFLNILYLYFKIK